MFANVISKQIAGRNAAFVIVTISRKPSHKTTTSHKKNNTYKHTNKKREFKVNIDYHLSNCWITNRSLSLGNLSLNEKHSLCQLTQHQIIAAMQ